MTIAMILKEIRRQLDWRGPSLRGQGHIVLTREMAERLDEWAIMLIKERDELVARMEGK
jgi:hypothetical protein